MKKHTVCRGLERGEVKRLIRAYGAYCRVRAGVGTKAPVLPEDVTENLVRMYIERWEGRECWWGKTAGVNGDLWIGGGKKGEVKGFASRGPLSFGPRNRFDELWFVDARDLVGKGGVRMYKSELSFDSDAIQDIWVNRRERFRDQCRAGRRPRVAFERFVEQVGEGNVQLVYDDCWAGLLA